MTCQRETLRGTATSWRISAGQDISIEGLDYAVKCLDPYKKGCLITKAELKYITPKENDSLFATSFVTSFEAIPSDIRFCNPSVTPKPVISGHQTAVVQGAPSNDDLKDQSPYNPDTYGNIEVTFRWDFNKIHHRIRVSQISAGNGWGSMFIPHPGNEVVITFEEGDPDRPLIIGRVYNHENLPPISPKLRSTRSYIMDKSGNRIVFYQDKGDEAICFYSPYGETMKTIGSTGPST
jgi:uncharacterized protein involved in type VI secretion and phage assembly